MPGDDLVDPSRMAPGAGGAVELGQPLELGVELAGQRGEVGDEPDDLVDERCQREREELDDERRSRRRTRAGSRSSAGGRPGQPARRAGRAGRRTAARPRTAGRCRAPSRAGGRARSPPRSGRATRGDSGHEPAARPDPAAGSRTGGRKGSRPVAPAGSRDPNRPSGRAPAWCRRLPDVVDALSQRRRVEPDALSRRPRDNAGGWSSPARPMPRSHRPRADRGLGAALEGPACRCIGRPVERAASRVRAPLPRRDGGRARARRHLPDRLVPAWRVREAIEPRACPTAGASRPLRRLAREAAAAGPGRRGRLPGRASPARTGPS